MGWGWVVDHSRKGGGDVVRRDVGGWKILWVVGWDICGMESGGYGVGGMGGWDGGGGSWGCGEPWLTGWEVMGMGRGNKCLLGGGEGVGVGLYSLSSSVGSKAGDFTASEVSLAFPFRLAYASILLLRREFSCFSASISSALRFFKSASSCCIFAWPSRMAAKSGTMLGGPKGPASACLLAPALLRVETIFREKRVLKVFVSCPTVGANCSCREQIRD